MSLLAQEFAKPVTTAAFKEALPAKKDREKPAIEIDENLRNKLKDFTYSFSSLTKALACPFLFYFNDWYCRNLILNSFLIYLIELTLSKILSWKNAV